MPNILVIEDDELVRESILAVLDSKGFQVLSAENGLLGVQLAEAHLPDLILCDILMPGLDGYEVLSALSSNPDTQGIPFIFLTAKVEKANWRKAMKMGADDYLTKPFTAEELLEAIAGRFKRQMLLTTSSTSKRKSSVGVEPPIFRFAINQDIPLQQDSFWQVRHGLVKLTALLVEGEEIVIGWAIAPMIFGTSTIFPVVHFEAKAIGKVELTQFSAQDLSASPQLVKALLPRIHQSDALLAVCGQRRADDRLKGLLLLLKKELGEPTPEGTRLKVRFTHQELASTIGTARATVTLLLNEFKQNGWIAVERDHHLRIKEALS
jgi:CheY-like chemotaxis protein/CRP-like cAMP-binding protein